MNWYYFTTEAGLTSEEAAFIEPTARLDNATGDERYQARREFEFIRKQLNEMDVPHEVAEEDCYNGDIFILGSTGKPLTELR